MYKDFDENEGGFVDKELICKDCGQPFTFTAGEQDFYEKKSADLVASGEQPMQAPKRCKECRLKKKQNRR